jgi:hypothetical protein
MMLRRLIRRALQRMAHFALGPRAFITGLLLLVVAGAGWLFFQSGASLPGPNLALPGPRGAPTATENYLKGNQSYNAELMWTSLSEEALDRFRSRGGTVQDMQRQLDTARERGSRLDQINYVGGYPLPDGSSLQFYVVASRGPSARTEAEYVTYIFTLDRAGKISKVQ